MSVATEYGRKSAEKYAENISCRRMDKDELSDFISKNNITEIVDTTHPYAKEISENAIHAAQKTGIRYIRFERKSPIPFENIDGIKTVSTVEEAIELINGESEMKKIFLGTGSNNLEKFISDLEGKEIFVRVIPSSAIIDKCKKLNMKLSNIVAMQGPFSESMNIETFRHFGADTLVTKESGNEGGFVEKIKAAQKLNMNIIVIKRPCVDYPEVVDNIEQLFL